MTNKRMAYLYLTITFCAWGSLYVVSKSVLGKIPVFTTSLMRYIIAAIALFIILKTRNTAKIERRDYKYVFLIGFIGYFLSTVAQLWGTKLSNASIASLINSMNPVTIMLFAIVILKEKITTRKVVCIILAIIGVYTIIGDVNGSGQVLGGLISILSVFLWSFVSVIVRQITQKYDPLQITTYGIIIALICTLPFSIYELIITPNIQYDWTIMPSFLYMGLICTALAYVCWNKSLSMIEAGTCSLFYPVQPMIAVLLGWLFLGESINTSFVFGTLLIIGGIIFSTVGKLI